MDVIANAAPHGRHLIAGAWVSGADTFVSDPVSGPPLRVSAGSAALVDQAATAAEAAFAGYAVLSIARRAAFLDAIADAIEARAAAITAAGTAETGLPSARLEGERARTTGQLRLFARHIERRAHLDQRHDPALPDRTPAPRPDLKLLQRPLGPVAVFGASNFPLAFSTAGGDTAAALAAGCPVVVKGHEAHPHTAEIVADAIREAVATCAVPAGVFSQIHGGSRAVGAALVQHPLIKAVGFTGSLAGGRALYKLCAARDEPIPFFGELGSVNPMFLLPAALAGRGPDIAKGWANSLTMGVGQFCTNPGIAVVRAGREADQFVAAAVEALGAVEAQPMLTKPIATAFREGAERIAAARGVGCEHAAATAGEREGAPALYTTDGATLRADPSLAHEVFGPLGIVVRAGSDDEMVDLAAAFEGQLTATLHLDQADTDLARRLMPILERKAGRVLANGFPTGVEVADAMVHGGPFPASTNFGATSVGTLAIRRFLRPVCYQNMPDALLPSDWADAAPSSAPDETRKAGTPERFSSLTRGS